MPALPPDQNPSIDSVIARNATRVNLSFRLPGEQWARVGRVQSMSQDTANNVQVLMELGSQFAVEMKKGITTFSFSIARFYCRSDVYDRLALGAVFGLQISDDSGASAVILEQFQQCSMNSVSKSYSTGQATIGANASIVTIGKSNGNPD